MRRIEKDYLSPPEVLFKKGAISQTQRAIQNQKGDNFTAYQNLKVRTALSDLYFGKCAYCEQEEEGLHIEHYRPKDGLSNDNELECGYFWLGNEWSNLLLACAKCNQKKTTHFPIMGKRFVPLANENFHFACFPTDKPLFYEMPLLLNPELFAHENEGFEHFSFDLNGQIEGKSIEGITTIKICKLDRDWLLKKRKKIADKMIKEMERVCSEWLLDWITDEGLKYSLFNTFESLKNAQNENQPFTLWGKYMYIHFEKCFLNRLGEDYRDCVKIAFEKYQQGRLLS